MDETLPLYHLCRAHGSLVRIKANAEWLDQDDGRIVVSLSDLDALRCNLVAASRTARQLQERLGEK